MEKVHFISNYYFVQTFYEEIVCLIIFSLRIAILLSIIILNFVIQLQIKIPAVNLLIRFAKLNNNDNNDSMRFKSIIIIMFFPPNSLMWIIWYNCMKIMRDKALYLDIFRFILKRTITFVGIGILIIEKS